MMTFLLYAILIYLALGILMALIVLREDLYPKRILTWGYIFGIIAVSSVTWSYALIAELILSYKQWKNKKKV